MTVRLGMWKNSAAQVLTVGGFQIKQVGNQLRFISPTGAVISEGNAGTLNVGALINWQVNQQGQITVYSTVATAGIGVPPIYAAVFLTGQTSAVTLSYTPPARAGSYKLEFTVYVTAAGTSTIPQLSYHDMAGGVHTSEAMAMKQTTTTNAAVVSIVATGTWVYVGGHIGVDNSGTAISVVTTPTASTFSIDGEILEYQ